MKVDSNTIERTELEAKVLPELQQIAETLGVQGHQRLRKGPLIDAIVAKASSDGHAEAVVEDGAEGPTSKSQREEAGEGDLLAEGDGRPSAEGESASPAQASAASDDGGAGG